jgi:pyridoxamine 5'-phosphate oxidase
MKIAQLMNELQQILEDVRTGIMSTVDDRGHPHSRWLTPVVLRDRPGVIYAVSVPDSEKIVHIRKNPNVAWLIQEKTLNTVIHVQGRVNVVDNPSLKVEILEALGPKLFMFWSTRADAGEFLVLETIIENAYVYYPMKDQKMELSE